MSAQPEHYIITQGGAACPVIIHVPHSSREIPEEVAADFVATDAQLAQELDRVTDDGTLELATAAREQSGVDAWMIVNNLSRLVADPGRFSNERDSMDASGRGAVYMKLGDGNLLRPAGFDTTELRAKYYEPYAEAVTELTRGRLDALDGAVIVDVHSYSNQPDEYQIHPGTLLPDICIGTHSIHTPALLADVTDREFTAAGFSVERNTPFTGVYIPVEFTQNMKVLGVMIEVRKDILSGERAADVAAALAKVIRHAEEIAQSEVGRPL